MSAAAAVIAARRPWFVEGLAAALVIACFARFGPTSAAVLGSFFAVVLVVVSAVDLQRRIIPNRIVLPATVIMLVARVALSPDRAVEWTVAALAAAGFLFLALLLYPPGMGMGDVKLALFLGAGLGKAVAFALVLGVFGAAVFSAGLLAARGAAGRKTGIPFGPFLAAGALVALFVGDPEIL